MSGYVRVKHDKRCKEPKLNDEDTTFDLSTGPRLINSMVRKICICCKVNVVDDDTDDKVCTTCIRGMSLDERRKYNV